MKAFLKRAACALLCIFCFVSLGCSGGQAVPTPNAPVRPEPITPPAVEKRQESRQLPVIMYHSVLKYQSNDFIVSPNLIRQDLELFKRLGMTTVSIKELIDFCKGNGSLPEHPVLLTFDDGNLNNLTYALPLFLEYGAKGVVSVVGSFTERAVKENAHDPRYSSLTWDEIKTLNASGNFEIGNHTYDMHKFGPRFGTGRLHGESDEHYKAAVTKDVSHMQDLLRANSGITPTCFAFPYGKISGTARQAVQELGFDVILTCNEGVNKIVKGKPATLLSLKRYNRTPQRNLPAVLKLENR